ncbi:MAG: capsular polysaccharide synthesis protein [Bifidobacterium sp.]|nr:capsular polysaccharide synthesis protein [Bifidobacterium sp.]
MMSKLQAISRHFSGIIPQVRNARALLGNKVAAMGLIHHATHAMKEPYQNAFDDALWSKVMRDIPFEVAALDSMPLRNDGPVWVMWWQGLNGNAPAVIRACVDSIRRHAAGREVIVLSKDNYTQYVSLDPVFRKRVELGALSVASFSDALRMKLLHDRGGVWIDATLYLTDNLSDEIEKRPFYTILANRPPCKWTTYFLASAPGNPLMDYIYRCTQAVFEQVDGSPEYFMTDAMLRNAYRHIPAARAMIDSVPCNNAGRFEMSEQMGSTATCPTIDPGTYINKLTYKIAYPTSVDGKPTLYQRVLDGLL